MLPRGDGAEDCDAGSQQDARLLKPERNAPCPCGSGEKYKRCCGSVSARPDAPGAPAAQQPFLRGVQALQSGKGPEAVSLLIAAIEADPGHFDAHLALGAALMQSGRFDHASEVFRRAVSLRPDSAAAYRDLGAAYDHQNLHEQAIAAFCRAVELAPKLGDIHLRLAQLYTVYSRMADAADSLDRAADIKPKTTAARLYRADAHMLRGDPAAAEEWARRAVTLEPGSEAAHGTLAGIVYAQGRFEQAASHFETALRLNPASAKSWDGLVHCRTYSPGDTAILDRMNAALQRRELGAAERVGILFAAGKVLDDCGDYAQAMRHFDEGNRLRGRDLTFDRADLAGLVDRHIAVFTRDFIARQAAAASQDATPVFIVGMYRSGTTLAEQILSSHSGIAAGGELTVWSPSELEIDAASGAFDGDGTRGATAKYIAALRRIGPSAARVTDKLPTNFFRLGAIHALLPNARIIHCQRDPIDTCLSIYTTFFSSRVPYASRKDDLVFVYRQYLRMMDHWRAVLPDGVMLDVQYESLVAEREAQTRRMIAFVGLAWEEACLAPELNKRAISTASAWQARQPVYATSLERWRRYEPWIGELRQLGKQSFFEKKDQKTFAP